MPAVSRCCCYSQTMGLLARYPKKVLSKIRESIWTGIKPGQAIMANLVKVILEKKKQNKTQVTNLRQYLVKEKTQQKNMTPTRDFPKASPNVPMSISLKHPPAAGAQTSFRGMPICSGSSSHKSDCPGNTPSSAKSIYFTDHLC